MNPLQIKDLGAINAAMNPSERVRRRLNEILAAHKGDRNWTQAAVADRIEGRNQSWVSKVCRGKDNGGLDVMLEDLDVLAEALQTTAVELVRDSDRFEFVADLKPHEMVLLRQFRRLGAAARDAVLTVVAHLKPAAGIASKGSHAQEVDPLHIRELAQEIHAEVEEERGKQEAAQPPPNAARPQTPPTRPGPRFRNRRR